MNLMVYQLKDIEDRLKHIEQVLSNVWNMLNECNSYEKLQQIEQYIEENLYYIDTETYEKKYYTSGEDIKAIINGNKEKTKKR